MEAKKPYSNLARVGFQLRATGIPAQPPNPLRSGIHHRGYLPHVKRDGASYFITFRLGDSLPQAVLHRLLNQKAERLHALKIRRDEPSVQGGSEPLGETPEIIERDYRREVERYLDRGAGACHLRRPEIAEMVRDSLRFCHERQYFLDDWVVMPNHVHLILWPRPDWTLSVILKSRKQFTATRANRILGRTGEPFWQPESFDHWIRNDAEKERFRRYIRLNTVKAGLCARPEDWRWSSAWREPASP
jgi:REP element-mobilizing transposase RayT